MDRHLPHDTARNARFFIGVVNAAKMEILSAGQHLQAVPELLQAASDHMLRAAARTAGSQTAPAPPEETA